MDAYIAVSYTHLPSIVKTGATKSAYSHSKNLQAAAGQVQLWAIPITPPPKSGFPPGTGAKPSLPAIRDI